MESEWTRIGTVVGNTTVDSYTFILESQKAKVGDLISCETTVPIGTDAQTQSAYVWGRITSINRFNPFFPAEAAMELANEQADFIDTVLSNSRDHLEATVLIIGYTSVTNSNSDIQPLRYPVQPSAPVRIPPSDVIRTLLVGDGDDEEKVNIGGLIGRDDVKVFLSAQQIVSRHMAVLAMTGGGKTVAVRRIVRDLADYEYPLVIVDPHGDYLGLYEKMETLKNTKAVKVFYPRFKIFSENIETLIELVFRLGPPLSVPQKDYFDRLISAEIRDGVDASEVILDFMDQCDRDLGNEDDRKNHPTYGAVKRSLKIVRKALIAMDKNNERLRKSLPQFKFTEMPDPRTSPEKIVAKGQISIFYLAGFDHLSQSSIVAMVLEQLFNHRAELSDAIPPFQAVIEEAHNFIPNRSESQNDTPSLHVIRKLITEGRKFGTGLIIVSQRPSRLDETTLAQCNSFLVLRLVNPRDKSFVRSVMENLSESDANILQTFGKGQGIVSGQAVRFPLLVQVDWDKDLETAALGEGNFFDKVRNWELSPEQKDKHATQDNTKKARESLRKKKESRKKSAKRSGIEPPE